MPKSKIALSAIILFLVINTSYFWQGMLGFFVMFMLLAIVVVFLILAFAVFRQLYFAVKEKFSNKQRLYKIAVVSALLTIVVVRPYGLINYKALESENILVAEREGVANCTTTLLLKQNGRFKMRSICFGVEENIGTYTIHSDTVKFNYLLSRGAADQFKYAVLDSTKHYLKFYNTKSVTTPYLLRVTVNKTKLR